VTAEKFDEVFKKTRAFSLTKNEIRNALRSYPLLQRHGEHFPLVS
jgi:hypothetical protein